MMCGVVSDVYSKFYIWSAYQHIDLSDRTQASMWGDELLEGKWLKIYVDQIVRMTDTGQLKKLYVTARWIILKGEGHLSN